MGYGPRGPRTASDSLYWCRRILRPVAPRLGLVAVRSALAPAALLLRSTVLYLEIDGERDQAKHGSNRDVSLPSIVSEALRTGGVNCRRPSRPTWLAATWNSQPVPCRPTQSARPSTLPWRTSASGTARSGRSCSTRCGTGTRPGTSGNSTLRREAAFVSVQR